MDISRIHNTLGKMAHHLSNHNSICVSVSGGSDSDIIVHMIATYFRQYLYKIHFVFVNTGLEYRATLRHLEFLEKRYRIKIVIVQGIPIPLAVKTYGIPFISKNVSEYIKRLQSHGFDFSEITVEEGLRKYGNVKVGLRWWCNDWGDKSRFNIDRLPGLKEFLKENQVPFQVSPDCCYKSKKKPLVDFQRSVEADLVITGVRKSEGGVRSEAYKNCFKPGKNTWDLYMPLFYWDNETKGYYKREEGIIYSDCYELWGMRRTGCVGCPFALKREEELSILRENEPLLYKACWNVFGESYLLTDKFHEYRRQMRQSEGESK